MNQYIITEELLIEIGSPLTDPGRIIDIKETVRSTPYNPQAEQEKVLDEYNKNPDAFEIHYIAHPQSFVIRKKEELRQSKEEQG